MDEQELKPKQKPGRPARVQEMAEEVFKNTPKEEKPVPNDTADIAKEEQITITKSGLMKMLEEIRNGDQTSAEKIKDLEWQEYTTPKRKNYTATIKVYQTDTNSPKGLIVDWKRLKTAQDPETKKFNRDIYALTVRYDDGREETIEISVGEFNRFQEIERVEILEFKDRKMAMKQGETLRSVKTKDDMGNEMTMDAKTGEKVPLMVLRDETICKVKRSSGEVFDINVNRLNS